MENYRNSDYALNKFSKGIVYRFANEIIEVTLEDYLANNPDKTEDDFRALKKLSDEIYLEQVRTENAQTKRNMPLDKIRTSSFYKIKSAEETVIDRINECEGTLRQQRRRNVAKHILDKLTEVQRRRYQLYAVYGLTTRKIAKLEGVAQRTVMDSLQFAEKKIKKILAEC